MARSFLGMTLALVAAALACASARADGLPLVGVDAGPEGVADLAATTRYLALPAGRGTLVARIEQDGGRVVASGFLQGFFAVPLVAFDGSAGGLSADGRTLVLIRPRVSFPRARTAFAVLDARRLRVRDEIVLRGDFSFDALSPDGSALYLIEYLSPDDPNVYAVRLYDLEAGRLLPDPIVDPRELPEAMRGYPVTRAVSPDGRWAYTLYDGAGERPFVHALDTVGRAAICIELDALVGRGDVYELRLDVAGDGRTLEIRDGTTAVAVVDTRTFAVEEPVAPAIERPAVERPPDTSGGQGVPARPAAGLPGAGAGVPWAFVGAGGGALAALAAIAAASVRRRRNGTDAAGVPG